MSDIWQGILRGAGLALIKLEQIHKAYQSGGRETIALRDVSLSIQPGEIFGIIGRSGAGKSTLIRMLNLLERPGSGEVVLNDVDMTALDERALRKMRHRIGMVFQHFNLLQSKTVLENVCLPMRLAGVPRARQIERAHEVLALVGLQDHAQKYPRQLSGGQQQRVGIARALANEPQLLLCDEATSALDPETTQSILALLAEINERLGITIVLITHSMDVIRQICHRVAVVEAGEIVESGEVLDVLLRPSHVVTRGLLSQDAGDAESWRRLLPEGNAGDGRVLRLRYEGLRVTEPLISQISRDLSLDISILQGSVGMMGETPYGQLVIHAQGGAERLLQLTSVLQAQGVDYEELEPWTG